MFHFIGIGHVVSCIVDIFCFLRTVIAEYKPINVVFQCVGINIFSYSTHRFPQKRCGEIVFAAKYRESPNYRALQNKLYFLLLTAVPALQAVYTQNIVPNCL